MFLLEKNKLYLPNLFETELQTKVVETLLQDPEKSYTLAKMARQLDATSGGIKRCVIALQKHDYVTVISHTKHCYLFALNKDNKLVEAVIPLYERLETFMSCYQEIPEKLKKVEQQLGLGDSYEK